MSRLLQFVAGLLLVGLVTASDQVSLPAAAVHVSVFDKTQCFFSVECGLSHYCTDVGRYGGVCRRRRGVGGKCESAKQCVGTAFCLNGRCAAKRGRGRGCASTKACRTGLVCRGRRCLPPRKPVWRGGKCAGTADCGPGLYCRAPPRFPDAGRCARQFADGAACDFGKSQCRGYCKFSEDPNATSGKCRPVRRVGGTCTDNSGCKLPFNVRDPRDRAFCNKRRNGAPGPGRCALLSQLKTRPGEACYPKNDLCDKDRDLVCRWAKRLRRHVCQGVVDGGASFCRKGSPFTTCAVGETCRIERVVPGSLSARTGVTVFTTKCLRKLVTVPRGASCEAEWQICPKAS